MFGKKRGNNGKRPGPPIHDDLVQRKFSTDDVNQLWLTDITEHRTDEGKLYLCAVKDVFVHRRLEPPPQVWRRSSLSLQRYWSLMRAPYAPAAPTLSAPIASQ
ncbi:hypothetical protein GCM10022231_11320 [Gordonia caeni]|uniref:Integrase catalytic domain-containing protein n=1 Tax=Gordonia caeni TaxID=1007097 RepID=A0ABP7NW04_9ACTN